LFNVVDIQIAIMFLRRTTPTALRAKVLNYVQGVYKVFIESAVV
jgi:hypothetical protein